MVVRWVADPGFLDGSFKSRSFVEALSSSSSSASFPKLRHATYRGLPSLWISKEEIFALSKPFQFALVSFFPTKRLSLDSIWNVFFSLKLQSDFSVTVLNQMHILIKLPHLFSPRILHALGSLFGTPLKVDNATSVGSRPSLVRVLVELDISKTYPLQIWLGPEVSGYIQQVQMEVFPEFCVSCKRLGHPKGTLGLEGSNHAAPVSVHETPVVLGVDGAQSGVDSVLQAPVPCDLVVPPDPNTCNKVDLVANLDCDCNPLTSLVWNGDVLAINSMENLDVSDNLANPMYNVGVFNSKALDTPCPPLVVPSVASLEGVECNACELNGVESPTSSGSVHSVSHLNSDHASIGVVNVTSNVTPTSLVPGPFVEVPVKLISPEDLFAQVGADVRLQLDWIKGSSHLRILVRRKIMGKNFKGDMTVLLCLTLPVGGEGVEGINVGLLLLLLFSICI
ncbi:hypothetical protein KFK09_020122 [Dendrobium nobile]|uniref:DUF4283 domain-containing protein n=1 Tax=Dendrobium nobile TaxID=94219 RepID=A0A8T3ASE7_DENNO|nr:hypothetical protein KFK09_020122 [Dendrobium nobile]